MSLADGVLSQEVADAFGEVCERWENGRMDPTDCESERVTHLGQAFGVPPRPKGFRPSGMSVKIPLDWNDDLQAMPTNVGEEVFYLVERLLAVRTKKGRPAREGSREVKPGVRRWTTGADPDRNVFDEVERRLGLPSRTVKEWYYDLKRPQD
jgi:hypothetical protein